MNAIEVDGKKYSIEACMGSVAYGMFLKASPVVQEIALKIMKLQIRSFETTLANCKQMSEELSTRLAERDFTEDSE